MPHKHTVSGKIVSQEDNKTGGIYGHSSQRENITILALHTRKSFHLARRRARATERKAPAIGAKAVYNLPTTRHLLDRLESDKVLRRICGWEKVSDIAKEWSFSRAFSEFSQAQLCERAHEALIQAYQSERLVGHVSRDSTAIEAREAAIKKEPKTKPVNQSRGRPKKGEQPKPKPPTRLERQLKMTTVAQMTGVNKSVVKLMPPAPSIPPIVH